MANGDHPIKARIFAWGPWVIAIVACVLSVCSLHRAKVPEPPPTHFGAPLPPPPSFFQDLRNMGVFYVNDPTFGAKCDGSTDDSSALQASINAATAVGGKWVIPPINASGARAICMTSQELLFNGPGEIDGNAHSPLTGGLLRASAPMAAVLTISSLHLWTGAQFPGISPIARVHDLAIDGNLQTTSAGLLRNSDDGSSYEHVYVLQSSVDGIGVTGRTYPLTISSITPGAGAPSGVTVTQVERNTGFGEHLETGAFTLTVKTSTGGGLGVGQIVVSTDGGVSYTNLPQTIQSHINLMLGMSSGGGFLPYPSGLQLTFPSQNYPLNGTYTISGSVPSDYGNGSALNTAVLTSCSATNNGALWTTTRVPYSGLPFAGQYYPQGGVIHALTGTIAATAGSQFLTYTTTGGDTISTIGFREGDHVFIGHNQSDSNSQYAMIAGIADDQTIVLAPPSSAWPISSYSGEDITFMHGAGYFEANGTENNNNYLIQFNSQLSSSDVRLAGLHGDVIAGLITGGAAGISMMAGGSNGFTWDDVFIHPDLGETHQILMTGLVRGGEFVGSGRGVNIIGQNPFTSHFQGNITSTGGVLQMTQNIVQIQQIPVTLSADTTQIPAPGSGGTSSMTLSTSSARFLTAVPTVATLGVPSGTVLNLLNTSAFPITFQHDVLSASKLLLQGQFVTLGTQESLLLYFNGTRWVQMNAPSFYNSRAGTRGQGNYAVKTTNTTATLLWEIIDNDPGVPGTQSKFDVVAQAQGGIDVAFWSNNVIYADANNNVISSTLGGAAGPGPNAPDQSRGAGANWRIKFTNSGGIITLQAVGDNVNPVYWRVAPQDNTAPVSF